VPGEPGAAQAGKVGEDDQRQAPAGSGERRADLGKAGIGDEPEGEAQPTGRQRHDAEARCRFPSLGGG